MCGQAVGKPLKDGRSQGTTVSTSKPEGEREESGPPDWRQTRLSGESLQRRAMTFTWEKQSVGSNQLESRGAGSPLIETT